MAPVAAETLVDSESHISVHRGEDNIVCCVWWNLKNFLDLKQNVIYNCPLDSTKSLCCPDWLLALKKYQKNVLVSTQINVVDKDVSFSLIANGSDTPFIFSAGKESTPGIYCCLVPRTVLEDLCIGMPMSSLVIMCRVVFDEKDWEEPYLPDPSCSCENLTRDMETMLISQRFSDIKLIRDQTEFPAHRCFLAARSPFLREMLDTDPTDKNPLVLQLDGAISNTAVVELLRYIYTGDTTTLNPDLAVSLYYLAEVLVLDKLRERCTSFLESNINVDAFLRIYNLALAAEAKPLRDEVEQFFAKNKKEIVKQFFSSCGEKMIRFSWMTPQEYVLLETKVKRLRKINMSTRFFDYE